MDMWLLIMNGILLGAILYYGRKVIKMMARAEQNKDNNTAEKERKRISAVIQSELNIYQHMVNMGDKNAEEIVTVLTMLVEQIEPRGKK
jgi:lysylphosphatidylglycerol synthetase-like protein (DUF2156 family)